MRIPGNLFGGLTIADIMTRMISRRRNLLVADLLYKIGLVENWGCGVSLIFEKSPDVQFVEAGDSFIAALLRHPLSEFGVVNGAVNGGVKEKSQIEDVYRYVVHHEGCRVPMIAEELSIPVRTTQRYLTALKKENRIIFKGNPKTGGYYST